MRLGQSRTTIWSMIFCMYSRAAFCCSGVPRKSRSGPRQAQTEPQASPALSKAALIWAGSTWEGSSMAISTVSKPHFLNCEKSLVLSLLNGEVKRKVLMPSLITSGRLLQSQERGQSFWQSTGKRLRVRGSFSGEQDQGRTITGPTHPDNAD